MATGKNVVTMPSEKASNFYQSQQQQQHPKEDDETQMHLDAVLRIIGYSSAYLVSIVVTVHVIIGICLIFRLLRVTLGSRVKPDGSKAILVTGATSGIGLVISKYFFHLGFTVICGYFNDQEPGYAELLELGIKSCASSPGSLLSDHNNQIALHLAAQQSDGGESGAQKTNKHQKARRKGQHKARLFLVRMDVRSRESIEKSSQEIDSILDQYNLELFCLINNAGVARDGFFQWSSRESIQDVIETNLTGVMMVTRQFLYRIIKSRGRVINVASGMYMFPAPTISVYGASKAAVAYFSDSLDTDLSGHGASCRCVVPGNFITSSNILFPRLRALQECIAKLTPEEKELYKDNLELYTKMMDRLVRKRFSLGDHLDPVQVSSVYRVCLPDDVMSGQVKLESRTDHGSSMLTRLIGWFFQKLDGGANAASLEASGLIQGYDYAVRLRSCPRRLYPGNRFYSHISGPIMDYLPKVVCDLTAKLLIMSLENQ